MRLHSTVGLTVKNLKYFVTTDAKRPSKTPKKIDQKLKFKKLNRISRGVVASTVEPGPANCITVLNKIMQTASFVIPSPKIKENSFGCSSYLTIEIAATTSVQHSKLHINIISIPEREN